MTTMIGPLARAMQVAGDQVALHRSGPTTRVAIVGANGHRHLELGDNVLTVYGERRDTMVSGA